MFSRLHHVLERQVPRPADLVQSDEDMWQSLIDMACLETTHRKAPCQYLGAEISKGKYEPDPAKWPARCYPFSQGKSKATVHFEWVGVSIDGKAHMVSMSVNDVLHHQRSLPQHPLAHTAPSGLTFSHHFMEAVAQNVHEAARFKGIAFEGERPSIVLQLPQGGIDVQDAPLYWTLPDGRCAWPKPQKTCSRRKIQNSFNAMLFE